MSIDRVGLVVGIVDKLIHTVCMMTNACKERERVSVTRSVNISSKQQEGTFIKKVAPTLLLLLQVRNYR